MWRRKCLVPEELLDDRRENRTAHRFTGKIWISWARRRPVGLGRQKDHRITEEGVSKTEDSRRSLKKMLLSRHVNQFQADRTAVQRGILFPKALSSHFRFLSRSTVCGCGRRPNSPLKYVINSGSSSTRYSDEALDWCLPERILSVR